ncbi:MAG: HisA/HisF-related TIM barrel protein [Acidobacteriota bacterium]
MQLIPAIDLRAGTVVRLEQGDDNRRTPYEAEPRALVERFAAAGVTLVHVVDLDAAFGETPQRELIADLVGRGAGIELGGGIRDDAAARWAFEEAGVERVVIGSMVVRDFSAFARLVNRYPGRVVPALEVAGEELRIAGWREAATVAVNDVGRKLRALTCPAVLVTDVERDGTLAGPNYELAAGIARTSGTPALLSGGVRNLDDLRAAVAVAEISGAIVGKALYEGLFTLEDALRAAGEPGS